MTITLFVYSFNICYDRLPVGTWAYIGCRLAFYAHSILLCIMPAALTLSSESIIIYMCLISSITCLL